MCKGGNSKRLKNENQANLWNNFKSLFLSYPYNRILFWFGPFFMKNKKISFFPGKWLLPLLTLLQWKKPYSKLFSGIKFLFVNRFSKFLWHFLRLLECKMMTW